MLGLNAFQRHLIQTDPFEPFSPILPFACGLVLFPFANAAQEGLCRPTPREEGFPLAPPQPSPAQSAWQGWFLESRTVPHQGEMTSPRLRPRRRASWDLGREAHAGRSEAQTGLLAGLPQGFGSLASLGNSHDPPELA